MGTNDLVEAVNSQPPAPCETRQCEFRSACASKEQACPDYWRYVNQMNSNGTRDLGKPLAAMTEEERGTPNREIYNAIFNV